MVERSDVCGRRHEGAKTSASKTNLAAAPDLMISQMSVESLRTIFFRVLRESLLLCALIAFHATIARLAMHESFFSYTLTKPYPYRWFTWVVAVGGVAVIIFFSFLNMAANGYTLEVVYTTDPNGTLAESQWFQKPPWTLMNKVEASCQSQGLTLNTQLFTTHLGLTYELANVWSDTNDSTTNIFPSLTYLNNTLENCSVNNIGQLSCLCFWLPWGTPVALFKGTNTLQNKK